eukprot:1155866-Pelagomonas_calceolata.AAC.4
MTVAWFTSTKDVGDGQKMSKTTQGHKGNNLLGDAKESYIWGCKQNNNPYAQAEGSWDAKE